MKIIKFVFVVMLCACVLSIKCQNSYIEVQYNMLDLWQSSDKTLNDEIEYTNFETSKHRNFGFRLNYYFLDNNNKLVVGIIGYDYGKGINGNEYKTDSTIQQTEQSNKSIEYLVGAGLGKQYSIGESNFEFRYIHKLIVKYIDASNDGQVQVYLHDNLINEGFSDSKLPTKYGVLYEFNPSIMWNRGWFSVGVGYTLGAGFLFQYGEYELNRSVYDYSQNGINTTTVDRYEVRQSSFNLQSELDFLIRIRILSNVN